jgi:hypothetical protein
MTHPGPHLQRRRLGVLALALLVASVGVVPRGEAQSRSSAGPDPDRRDVIYKLVFPIAGEYTYVRDFGDPRSGGRTHAGTDIMADKMVPVVAAADGTVRWMHDERGGNCCAVALEHDDGWRSRYIHLNNDTPGTDDGRAVGIAPGIRVGARVKAGQLIGYVGDSGNAEATASHLHFELRRPDGTPVNPYASLQAAAVSALPEIEGPAVRPPQVTVAPDVLRPPAAPDVDPPAPARRPTRRTRPDEPAAEPFTEGPPSLAGPLATDDELLALLRGGEGEDGPGGDGGTTTEATEAIADGRARPVRSFIPVPEAGVPLVDVPRAPEMPEVDPGAKPMLGCWGGSEDGA